ncbi:MAG: PEP/pyruvate-binding domain-containing protein [Pseudomonadota bacterium]
MTPRSPLIVFPGEAGGVESLGGKGAALAELSAAGFPVPLWLAVTPAAFYASAGVEPGTAVTPEQAANVAARPELAAEIEAAARRLAGDGGWLAVRSSAGDEDSRSHSFAGQLESYLFVSPEKVAAKAAEVWRSGFSARVAAYRTEHGLGAARPPAVVVQRMIDADRAGVTFSADPVTGARGTRVVSAVFGLGSALVSGEADADTWRVSRAGIIGEREIADKSTAHRSDPQAPEGVSAVELPPEQRRRPALTDEEVRAVAELAARAEAHFGAPQDIEWAFEDGTLWLLQSRAITSLAGQADPDGPLVIWDNSNITESYSGVTTPLTFSFVRRAYEEVYREFCRLLGVPAAKIADHAGTFRNMLGLIRGRVYYNLISWYRVLALLPGFTVNRRFMEQMMGVREPMPEEIVRELAAAGAADRVKDALFLARSVGMLAYRHATLQGCIDRFYRRLNDALAPRLVPLAAMRMDELAAYYRDLERRLLTRWDAPLVNDFFAMIFYGVLRALVAKWLGQAQGTLQNDLLCGEGGMISAEPAKRVKEMARLAAQDGELAALLREGEPAGAFAAIARHPKLQQAYSAYIERFGDRCLEELKLESATLHDDPTTLLRSIGHMAQRLAGGAATESVDVAMRSRAEAQVAQALREKPFKRWIFNWVLKHARARVRDRENLRFERTRLFGQVRRIVVELGRRLHALERLAAPRDVFWLEIGEVLGFVEGTATTVDFPALAAARRREFQRYREEPAPAERFETRGAVHQGNRFEAAAAAQEVAQDENARTGIGCCPGVVRGRVRVVTDPRGAVVRQGEILVAERTDPGWIMLFPACAGLLVERGSLLSHSAIVAREMGIPAIVSLPGVTRWLATGDWVELDGASGRCRRIDPEPEETPVEK